MNTTESNLVSELREQISSAPVVIYMKGSEQFPQCGFSARACQVLRQAGVKSMRSIDVLENDALWDALELHTKWPTVPQIFINGEFIGGCDIVTEMYETGELQEKLKG